MIISDLIVLFILILILAIFLQNIVFHRYCHIDTHTRLKIHTYTWMMIQTDTDTVTGNNTGIGINM